MHHAFGSARAPARTFPARRGARCPPNAASPSGTGRPRDRPPDPARTAAGLRTVPAQEPHLRRRLPAPAAHRRRPRRARTVGFRFRRAGSDNGYRAIDGVKITAS
ncbi:hypothetical protein GCM10010274_61180 [Streptomyces lavendofoliae]|uniref:Uncharacterized protein n=1 Tax=Streptomyces lavendofoliae TaxID=67314 RepID=A0A918I5B2_9ACTN|nr:hypothetical protein GCM10010274_61180 [Streptomyces lavendofoliae]